MIFTRFGFQSGWPAHKNLPVFKRCFNNLVSLKTGSKIISLLWMLLFSGLFFIELRTALEEDADESRQLSCLFNHTREGCLPTPEGGIFLYGNYKFVVNESSGTISDVQKFDDGLYEWNIFCTCLLYSMLVLSCSLLYLGVLYDKTPFILTWLGLTQVILLLEVCTVIFNFVFLVKNDQYLEYLSFSFLLHLGFVGFVLYSLLIINSYVLSLADTGKMNSMVG